MKRVSINLSQQREELLLKYSRQKALSIEEIIINLLDGNLPTIPSRSNGGNQIKRA